MKTIHRLAGSAFVVLAAWCMAAEPVQRLPFGSVDGKPVDLYVLTGADGFRAKVMTYGATLTELLVPDRDGTPADVVLGFDTLEGYRGKNPYFGATVGRVGNRIAKGRFSLGGKTYQLATNDGANHLHGGIRGFDKVVWSARPLVVEGDPAVEFTYVSADGEEGYPGRCSVTVLYRLTGTSLALQYTVTTDRDTPVNVTNHSYFNLSGPSAGGILSHIVTLYAPRYTPVDAGLIPTGELRGVQGTPMDFLKPTPIGARIQQVGGNPVGYDHNFVVDPALTTTPAPGPGGLSHVATVRDPRSGRVMDVWSTEPGVQFYSGNFLDGTITGKQGVVYRQYQALALETQHFPDSVNHANFPSYVVRAGETYRSSTYYTFSAH